MVVNYFFIYKTFFKVKADVIVAIFIKMARGTDRDSKGYISCQDLIVAKKYIDNSNDSDLLLTEDKGIKYISKIFVNFDIR